MDRSKILNSKIELQRITSDVNFNQTLELQVILKGYDTKKDKVIIGTQILPNPQKPNKNICIIGDLKLINEAIEHGYKYMDLNSLKEFNREKKPIKKFIKNYDGFVASDTIIRKIPKLLGPMINKYGKFPTIVTDNDNLSQKIKEVEQSVKWRFKKKHFCHNAVGHQGLTNEQLTDNVIKSINYIRSLLKPKQEIEKAVIKFTMGPPKIII